MEKPKNAFDLSFRPLGSVETKQLVEEARKSRAATKVIERKKRDGTFNTINPVSAATKVRTSL